VTSAAPVAGVAAIVRWVCLPPPNRARIQPAVPKTTAAVAAIANSRHADCVIAVPPM
jgi:hypothetical protein